MPVISILNSNKLVEARIVRALKAKTMCDWYLHQVNSSKKSRPDIYKG